MVALLCYECGNFISHTQGIVFYPLVADMVFTYQGCIMDHHITCVLMWHPVVTRLFLILGRRLVFRKTSRHPSNQVFV